MRVFIFIFFLSFQLIAQETHTSRKAGKIYREAKSLIAVKDLQTAKSLLQKALSIDHQFVEAWILLGDVNIGLEDKEAAIQAYKKSIPIAPRFSFPMNYRLDVAEHSKGS